MSVMLHRIHKHKALYKIYSPYLDVTLHGLVVFTDISGQTIGLVFKFK